VHVTLNSRDVRAKHLSTGWHANVYSAAAEGSIWLQAYMQGHL
jgi:hypothetical protein